MLLREDFQKAIESSVARYPAVGALVKAGDPRILQHLDAMATMLGMYSAQLEVASAEPFEKTRDSTVLADAAMRGLVPKSSPARLKIAILNKGNAPGSSPLARGTPHSEPLRGLYERFIPAGAGNTSPHRWPMGRRAVHPRWRGEHGRQPACHSRGDGSSPLARGTLLA